MARGSTQVLHIFMLKIPVLIFEKYRMRTLEPKRKSQFTMKAILDRIKQVWKMVMEHADN